MMSSILTLIPEPWHVRALPASWSNDSLSAFSRLVILPGQILVADSSSTVWHCSCFCDRMRTLVHASRERVPHRHMVVRKCHGCHGWATDQLRVRLNIWFAFRLAKHLSLCRVSDSRLVHGCLLVHPRRHPDRKVPQREGESGRDGASPRQQHRSRGTSNKIRTNTAGFP